MANFTLPVPPESISGLSEIFGTGDYSIIPQLGVTVEISGMPELRKNCQNLNAGVIRAAVEEARRLAQYLKVQSQRIVPYKTGELFRSAFVHTDDGDSDLKGFVVGYDATVVQYAWLMHEIPMHHPTRGPYGDAKQDHFLSDPADELAAEFPDVMRKSIASYIESERWKRGVDIAEDAMTEEEMIAEARAALGLDD